MIEETEGLTPEENIRAETEILKLKLEIENDAKICMSDELKLSAEAEFDWYNHIHNYERLCKEAGYAKVYDFIGKPFFKALEDLKLHEIEKELHYLLEQMYSKGIILNYDEEEYKASTIYQFVTQELFQEEINCYRVPGGHAVFNYEEFYPNHNKDLNRYTEEYLEQLFSPNQWSPNYLDFTHEKSILVNGREMSLDDYSDLIMLFQGKPLTNPYLISANFPL